MRGELFAAIGLALMLGGCAAYTPAPRGETIERNLLYARRPTGKLYLDIYHPATPRPQPTILWIHGGGWKYGYKGLQFYLRPLTRKGFAIVSIEYRMSGRAHYPAQLIDARDALRWVQANGAAHGLQTDRIFLGGASAGGHLAALLGLLEGRKKVGAVCVMYPATNLTGFEFQDGVKGYLPELLGGSVNQKRALAEAGSPVNYVRRDAPAFLFFHGDKDDLVPLRQSEELHEKLRAKEVESTLVVLKGVGHNFSLDDAQLRQVASFLREHQLR